MALCASGLILPAGAKQARIGASAARPTVGQSSARATKLHERYPAPQIPFDEPIVEPPATDNLAQAIADTYETSPVLGVRRYELRATDDALGSALAETRAQAQVQVSAGYQFTDPGTTTQAGRPLVDRLNSPHIEHNDLGAQLIIDQPLSTGGRASAHIAAARADSLAGRQALRGSEGDLLVDLITAYADVRRDTNALVLRTKNLELLAATLDEVIERREAGELTRTDIAQAQTQLEAARVQLNAAQAQLEQSRAAFTAIVGREPGSLAPAPALPLLPGSIDEAFDTAEQFNPDLAAAIVGERASRARIAAARAEKRPSVAIRGIAGTTGPLAPFDRYEEDVSYSGRITLTIPLSSGGQTSSQIAAALNRNSADRLRIEATRRQMVQAIISAWNQMVSSERNVAAQEAQLKAARVFYEGTFQEYRAGLRSTFDVLYAQNALRDTEIALLANTRDRYVAQAALLRQLGQLEAGKLITGNTLYDPASHLREVERRSSLPWDPAIRALDTIGAPSQHQQTIERPARAPETPAMAPANPATDGLPLMTRSPITPIPGTTGRPKASKRP